MSLIGKTTKQLSDSEVARQLGKDDALYLDQLIQETLNGESLDKIIVNPGAQPANAPKYGNVLEQDAIAHLMRRQEAIDVFTRSGAGGLMPGRGQDISDVVGKIRARSGKQLSGPVRFSANSSSGHPYERRWFTDEVVSPITGQTEVVPFKDPNDTNKALDIEFGDRKKINMASVEMDEGWMRPNPTSVYVDRPLRPQQGARATEIVAEKAGQLAGIKIEPQNNVSLDEFRGARSNAEFQRLRNELLGTDFAVTNSKLQVDAEILKRGQNPSAQVYTQIAPNFDYRGDKSPEGAKAAIKRVMKERGISFEEAVESLTGEGPDKMFHHANKGKLLADKPDGTGKKVNMLIQPEFDGKEAADNISRYLPEFQKDKHVMKPESVKITDFDTLRNSMDNLNPDDLNFYQGTFNRNDTFKVTLPVNANNPAVTDISSTGRVPQILKDIDYVDDPQTPKDVFGGKSLRDPVVETPSPRMAGSSAIDEAVKAVDKPIERPRQATSPKPVAPVKPEARPPVARPQSTPPELLAAKPTTRPLATRRPSPFARPQRPAPRGEGGFVRSPGMTPQTRQAVTAGRKFAGSVAMDGIAELGIGTAISYMTGETDNLAEAALSAAGGTIESANTGGAEIRTIGDKTYHYDVKTNTLRDVDTGREAGGLAVKGGQNIVVPRGSVAGEPGLVESFKTGVKGLVDATVQTAQRRAREWTETTGSTSGRGAGRAAFEVKPAPTPPPPREPTVQELARMRKPEQISEAERRRRARRGTR